MGYFWLLFTCSTSDGLDEHNDICGTLEDLRQKNCSNLTIYQTPPPLDSIMFIKSACLYIPFTKYT